MVLDLLVAYLGFAGGIVLSLIAPEEMKPGRKYFQWAQRLMYGLLVVGGAFLLFREGLAMVSVGTLIIGAVLCLFLEKNGPRPFRVVLPYLLFTAVYFFLSTEDSLLLVSSGIFLYGLPTGTLVRLHWLERRERK